jgi:imidazolonepropionase
MKNVTMNAPIDIAVVNCGQLVTVAGTNSPRSGEGLRELGIIPQGVMLIREDRIVATGSYSQLKDGIASAAEVVDAGGRVVTPGLVDAHTHLVFGGTRADEFEQRIAGATYQEIAANGGGIQSTVAKTRAASEDALLRAAQTRLRWMLRSGTTTLEAKSGYGLSLEDELKCLRVLQTLRASSPQNIVSTVLAAHTVPAEFRDDRAAYVALVTDEILPAVKRHNLAKYCDAFCDAHAFTLEETRTVLEAAKRLGFGLRLHAEQFHSDGAALLAAELGAVTVDHLEACVPSNFAALRAANVQPVLLPASVFAIGRTHYPDARGMIAAGLAPVLATDFNPGSSPTTSLPFVMSLACLQMKMLPSEALVAATINAAHSLGLAGEIGSLEAGKRADFLIHEFDDYREIAYFVAAAAQPQVFIAGRRVSVE